MANRLVFSRVSQREQEEVGERSKEGWIGLFWARRKTLCGDRTVLYLDYSGDYTNLTIKKFHRTIFTCTQKFVYVKLVKSE